MTVIRNTGVRYAKNAHGQPNANANYAYKRINWSNGNYSSASNPSIQPNGSASSYYTVTVGKKTVYMQKPWTFTGHDFQLNIPDCAYIRNIVFTAKIKVSKKINVNSPQARFNLYNGSKSVSNNIKNGNGWEDGYYYANPNKKLSTSWTTLTYSMSGDEFRRRGYPTSELNEIRMGIDLRFQDPVGIFERTYVYIQYVSCYVEYEMPDRHIYAATPTSEDNPVIHKSGEVFKLSMLHVNNSNAGCCSQENYTVEVRLPSTVRLESYEGNYNEDTNIWVVNCQANSQTPLTLRLKDIGIGEHYVEFYNKDLGAYRYWYYVAPSVNDVGEVSAYPGRMQLGVQSCTRFEATVNASDGKANFNIVLSTKSNGMKNVTWVLDESRSSPGVALDSSDDTHVNFSVPKNKIVDIVFNGCFIPTARFEDGGSTMAVQLDENPTELLSYKILDAPTFVVRNEPKTKEDDTSVAEIQFNPSVLNFITHRVASSTELDAYVLDCGVAEFDSMMETDDCTFTADIWRKRNYIGMVELPVPHYDPKSTYENKEIYKNYKNKTYAGKEGSVDEDIDLNFRVPPKDTITLQGLVELDKPTPINANWQCFEGDPLNHRGWTVLSKLEVEKTNPLWYKCKGTVKYITHDINTKFQIFKESAVNNVDMPSILADTITLGDNLSNSLNILSVETDGGFVYDEDSEDGAKNLFSLDEGQTLSMKTVKPLLDVANVKVDWYSNRINETRENNIERVFRIRDKNGNSIFEYEYTDFIFSDDFVYCTVIMRIKDEVEGWRTLQFPNVDMRTEIEAELKETIDETVSYDTSIDEEEAESFVINLNEIITDSNNPEYDKDTLIAEYKDNLIRRIAIKVKDTSTYLYNQSINEHDSFEVQLDDISLTNVKHNDIINFSAYDNSNNELTEYNYDYIIEVNADSIQFFKLDDENGEQEEEESIAPTFNPKDYDITQIYGTSLEFVLNKNTLKVYDAGYNGREVVKEDITLINSEYSFETVWTNHNQDGNTQDIISYIDVGLSETILSATYSKQYSNLIVSPFPIPRKTIVFTRESEEGTIYYMTGEEPFKYRLEPFYQFLCGTDLVTREGASIFNLNNSHTYFYIENGLVRLGFNKFSGSLYLAKWDIVSKQWITTHYLHMGEDTKFSLETYSDDKIVIKAGDDTYFSIWRGHPYIAIENPNKEISIDSKFTYCLADMVDGVPYDYPVIASFLNDSNLLPVCIGGRTLDYDCICIDDDEISGGTNHTIVVEPPTEAVSGEAITLHSTITPMPTGDGTVHYLLDGVDIGSASSPFDFEYAFPITTNAGDHTLQAIYTGDEDDNIAISEIIPLVVKAPEPREGSEADTSYPENTGTYQLQMISAPSKFTYRDGKAVVLQLTKGGKGVRMPIEVQRPDGHTTTEYTNSNGILNIVNTSYAAGKYQWGGRFYDNIDADHDGKLLLSALRYITVDKATPKFTHNSKDNKVKKGKKLGVKLNGIDSIANSSKAGLKNMSVTYSINNGSKQTKKTNENGWIYIPFNIIGYFKIKLTFAGSKNYNKITTTIGVKGVK